MHFRILYNGSMNHDQTAALGADGKVDKFAGPESRNQQLWNVFIFLIVTIILFTWHKNQKHCIKKQQQFT